MMQRIGTRSSSARWRRPCAALALAAAVLGLGACRSKDGSAGGSAAAAEAAALAHVKQHGEWPTDGEWEVRRADEYPELHVTVYDVFPLVVDAAGTSAFVGAGDVFCDKDADAFERLVRAAGGAKHPSVLSPGRWVALYRAAAGIPGEVISSGVGLNALIGTPPADLVARLAPPTFTANPGGGFSLGFFFYVIGYPGGSQGIARADAVVAPDGRVTSKVDVLYNGVGALAAPPAGGPTGPLDVGGIPVIMLSPSSVTAMAGTYPGPGRTTTESAWTPSPDDVTRLLGGLAARLERDADAAGRVVAARLWAQTRAEPTDAAQPRYTVQIAGFVVGGKQLVFANFICDPERSVTDLDTLVTVRDGGDCYFQVWFDPASGEYPSLMINGRG